MPAGPAGRSPLPAAALGDGAANAGRSGRRGYGRGGCAGPGRLPTAPDGRLTRLALSAGPRGDGDGGLRPLYLDVQATTPLVRARLPARPAWPPPAERR